MNTATLNCLDLLPLTRLERDSLLLKVEAPQIHSTSNCVCQKPPVQKVTSGHAPTLIFDSASAPLDVSGVTLHTWQWQLNFLYLYFFISKP